MVLVFVGHLLDWLSLLLFYLLLVVREVVNMLVLPLFVLLGLLFDVLGIWTLILLVERLSFLL